MTGYALRYEAGHSIAHWVKNGVSRCGVGPADWLGGLRRERQEAVALPGCAFCDPIDVIARRILAMHAQVDEPGDWEDYPDIGEHDFADVIARVAELATAQDPDDDTYQAAYDHLAGRAEK